MTTLSKARDSIRRVAARADARARAASATGAPPQLVQDVTDLSFAVDVLCDVIAQMEFQATGKNE